MLAKINTQAGGVSNTNKSRFFNFQACLFELCTAAANSNPVVNPVNSSTGAKDTNHNCIELISNQEAGGWLAGNSSNINANTAFNASFSSPYHVDLYRSSGKSSAPYYRVIYHNRSLPFSTANSATITALQYIGGHTTQNPATTVYTSATPWVNVSTSQSSTSYRSHSGRDNQDRDFEFANSAWQNNDLRIMNLGRTDDEFYIATTSEYIILTNKNSVLYFGIRPQAAWETSRTDNPSWVMWGYTRGWTASGNYGLLSQAANQGTGETFIAAYGAFLDRNNNVLSPLPVGQWSYINFGDGSTSSYPYACAISGASSNNNSYRAQPCPHGFNHDAGLQTQLAAYFSTNGGYTGNTYIQTPVIKLNSNYKFPHEQQAFVRSHYFDAPDVDPTTGLSVPVARPIEVIGVDANQNNLSRMGAFRGVIPGILSGMLNTANNSSTGGILAYNTSTEYTIGNTVYIPVITGSNYGTNNYGKDLFFLRKA